MVMCSLEDIKKFGKEYCKMFSVPIRLYSSPYFEERMQLLDDLYETNKTWGLWQKEILNGFDNFEEYIQYKQQVITEMVADIQSRLRNSAQVNLPCGKVNKYGHNGSIYHGGNVDKVLISIDLVKSNFQMLKKMGVFAEDVVWEEYIGKFTDKESLKKSKGLRQFVFGNIVNVKQQTKLAEQYMLSIAEAIEESGIPVKIDYVLSDEIVMQFVATDKSKDMLNRVKAQITDILKDTGLECRVTCFKIYRIRGTQQGYIKKDIQTGGIELKAVSPDEIPYVVRYMKKEKPESNDNVFVSQSGRLASYHEPLSVEIEGCADAE